MHLYIGLDALQTRTPNFRKQTLTTVINSSWRQISLQQCILFHASEFQHKRSCASNHILKDGPDLVKRKPTGLPGRETLRTLSHAREGPASRRAQREGFFTPTAGNSLLMRIETCWGATLSDRASQLAARAFTTANKKMNNK